MDQKFGRQVPAGDVGLRLGGTDPVATVRAPEKLGPSEKAHCQRILESFVAFMVLSCGEFHGGCNCVWEKGTNQGQGVLVA